MSITSEQLDQAETIRRVFKRSPLKHSPHSPRRGRERKLKMNPPDKIYLQWDADEDDPADCTWCQDKINDTDVEYLQLNLIPSPLREMLLEYLRQQNAKKEITATNMHDALIEGLKNMGCTFVDSAPRLVKYKEPKPMPPRAIDFEEDEDDTINI